MAAPSISTSTIFMCLWQGRKRFFQRQYPWYAANDQPCIRIKNLKTTIFVKCLCKKIFDSKKMDFIFLNIMLQKKFINFRILSSRDASYGTKVFISFIGVSNTSNWSLQKLSFSFYLQAGAFYNQNTLMWYNGLNGKIWNVCEIYFIVLFFLMPFLRISIFIYLFIYLSKAKMAPKI